MPDHIFISYARKDGTNTAKKLFDKLQADGLNPWLDTENGIYLGDNWDDTIEEAIEECKALVFLMTPGSVESEVCALEWGMAWELKKPIFPVMLQSVKVPFRLRKRQYVDMQDSGLDEKYPELRDAIQRLDTKAGREEEEELREEEQTLVTNSSSSGKWVTKTGQLPELPEKYIGRKQMQADIRALLDDKKRVLVHAQGGEGKTSFAAQITETWVADGNGNVIWLQAGNADEDILLESLAGAVGMVEEFNKAEDKREIVASMIDIYEVKLVVIDDVWNGLALQRLLRLMPRGLPMLITSRQRQPSTIIRNLPALDVADARELIRYHAGEFADDEGNIDEICRLLGYLAFAIEIAGKTMQVNMWHTTTVITQIKDAPHTIKLPDEFAEEGKGNVVSLIESSLDRLPDTTRDVFLAFGAFPSPTLTVEMAGIFLKRHDVQDEMQQLVINGLATLVPATEECITYYRIHDLAHSYTASLYQEHYNVNHIIATFKRYVERHEEHTIEDFNALEAELKNLYQIISLVFSPSQFKIVYYIINGMFYISRARGKVLLHLNSLKTLYKMAIEIGDNYITSICLIDIAGLYDALYRWHQALECLKKASKARRDKRLEFYLYEQYASIYPELGEYKKAQKAVMRALELVRKYRLSASAEAGAFKKLAYNYYVQGLFPQATHYYQKILEIDSDSYLTKAECINNLGLIQQKLGNLPESIRLFLEGLKLDHQTGNKINQATAHTNLAVTYKMMDDSEQSEHHYRRALELFQSMNQRHKVKELNRLMAEVDEGD